MAKTAKGKTEEAIRNQGSLAQKGINEQKGIIGPQNDHLWNLYNANQGMQTQNYNDLMNQYYGFINTGGYSPDDLSNIRSRALSPTRAMYSNANRDMSRQASLQGGYSPGQGVLKARMARQMGQQLSDQSRATEGDIAQMVNQGKQFGLQGGTSLYGTTPALTNTFGNQVMASRGQALDLQQLQNQLGLGIMGAYGESAKSPSWWETAGKIGAGAVGAWRG